MRVVVSRSLVRFLFSGGATVAVDATVYSFLLSCGFGYNAAKMFGFASGVAFAFVISRLWTFDDHANSLYQQVPRFLGGYFLSCLINVGVNHLIVEVGLALIPRDTALILGWFVATGCSATFNYIWMRFFVFPSPSIGHEKKS